MDVLVIGAGPAGAVAALVLARAGARVRIIDRESFPRPKLCGDTLNPGALSLLDRLGTGDAVRGASLATPGMTITGPDGTSITADYPDGLRGAALTRRTLDALLLDAAVAAGAQFEPGLSAREPILAASGHVTGVRTVDRNSRTITQPASIVVAADGRRSALAFQLGLARPETPKRWAFGAYFSDVSGVTTHGEMHIRRDGYIGVAPLPGGITNVCVVRERSRLSGASDESFIRHVLSQDVYLNARFAGARQISDVVALGPLAVRSRSAGCAGLLLAGDAAGFVDPMTGDGLRFAIRGGELAARAALRELETGESQAAALYAARLREFRGKWRLNRSLRWLTATPGALQVASGVAARWHAPISRLVSIAGDCDLVRRMPALS